MRIVKYPSNQRYQQSYCLFDAQGSSCRRWQLAEKVFPPCGNVLTFAVDHLQDIWHLLVADDLGASILSFPALWEVILFG